MALKLKNEKGQAGLSIYGLRTLLVKTYIAYTETANYLLDECCSMLEMFIVKGECADRYIRVLLEK